MTRARSRLTAELEMPLQQELIATRRDLHKFAEPGWCEFRTASKIIRTLEALGWEVAAGRAVMVEDRRMGVPTAEQLEDELQRALSQGADPDLAPLLRGGFTGVVGILRGNQLGPTVALRFDTDANQGLEFDSPEHRPAREGFVSVNKGVHHNCGHDGHVAIGLGVARVLSEMKDAVQGEVRLIFQPAEEGLRGAASMVEAGVLKGVNYFLSSHIGVQAKEDGMVIAGYRNILASTKYDVTFTGRNAHAGISPHEGRNALLACAVAIQNLLAISRHGEGDTRVNVGLAFGGESRNAIPAGAKLSAEVRADKDHVLRFLEERAECVLSSAAAMHGVDVTWNLTGHADAANSDDELLDLIREAAGSVESVRRIDGMVDFKGSDDAGTMINAVQSSGGKAVYIGLGAVLSDVHHAPRFDFSEQVLPMGVEVLVAAVRRLWQR